MSSLWNVKLNWWHFISTFKNLSIMMCLLLPIESWAQLFAAEYAPLSSASYLPGQAVIFQAEVRVTPNSGALASSYIVQNYVIDPTGNSKLLGTIWNAQFSTSAPTALNFAYPIPVSATSGAYRHIVRIMDRNWKWMILTPNSQSFNVGVSSSILTASYVNLSQGGFFKPGQTINFRPSLRANVATGEGLTIQQRIVNSAGQVVSVISTQTGVVISAIAQTPLAQSNYVVPSNATVGSYKLKIVASKSSGASVQVNSSEQLFGVYNDAPKFTVTNAGPDKRILNRGDVVSFNDVIKASVSTSSQYQVIARVQDNYGLVLREILLPLMGISTADKAIPFSYLLPSNMVIGAHTVKYLVRSVDGSKSYEVSESNAKRSNFFVDVYNTDLSLVSNVPATMVSLKPKVATSNPMNGSGFIPATNDTFNLIFSDEFNGEKLDTSKWWTRYIYNNHTLDYLNDECQRYRERNNHPVGNGVLKLTARPRPGTMCYNNRYTFWESGMIRSKTLAKFGYFEARVKLPSKTGAWSAFWLNAEHLNWPPEIDIMEHVVNAYDYFANMMNMGVVINSYEVNPQGKQLVYSDSTYTSKHGHFKAPTSLRESYLTEEFHVISAYWNDDNTLTTFIDGNPITHWNYKWITNGRNNAPMAHILLNLAMGGSWPTHNFETTMTTEQTEYIIDYVRVYQKSTNIQTGQSTMGVDLCPETGC